MDEMFERDYSQLSKGFVSPKTDAAQDRVLQFSADKKIFAEINKRFRELPHVINPIKKVQYEKAVDMLNEYALKHNGKIQAVVSYEEFDAFIYLTMKFYEFREKENQDLAFIFNTARGVSFYQLEDGMMRMSVRYDYFEDVGDKDQIIADVLSEHPEVSEMIDEAHESELEEMLANPQIYSVLEKGSEQLGVTPEEYLRVIDRIYKEDPQFFLDMILGRKADDKNEEEVI